MYIVSCIRNKNYQVTPAGLFIVILRHYYLLVIITGVGLDRIFIFVVSDPSILPIWPLLIAL